MSQARILVDGEPMSRPDAVAHCKRAPGGAVVVIEAANAKTWDETRGELVEIEDASTRARWNETRSALLREGVRIYVQGPLCYDPHPLGCRPRLPPPERSEPIHVEKSVVPPIAPEASVGH